MAYKFVLRHINKETTKKMDNTTKETTKEMDNTTKEMDNTTKETTKEISDTTRGNVKELLKAAIQENSAITMKELAAKTKMTVDGVKYHLDKMRQEGILLREGSTKAGRWILRASLR